MVLLVAPGINDYRMSWLLLAFSVVGGVSCFGQLSPAFSMLAALAPGAAVARCMYWFLFMLLSDVSIL